MPSTARTGDFRGRGLAPADRCRRVSIIAEAVPMVRPRVLRLTKLPTGPAFLDCSPFTGRSAGGGA